MVCDEAADQDLPATKLYWLGLQSFAEDWARSAGLELAPPGEFIHAPALVEIAIESIRALPGDTPYAADFVRLSSEKHFVLVRNAANHLLNRIEQRRAPYGITPGFYWNVTCPGLPSRPLPTGQPTGHSNKKERQVDKRVAKGLPAEKDKEEFRVLQKENMPHFTRYTDELLQLTCAPAMLELRLFPNAKELSESFACFAAVRAHLGDLFRPRDPEVTVLVVGDGATPRTAALFAFRTAWRCVSVDPLLEEPSGTTWSESIERLQIFSAKIEEVPAVAAERLLLVLPHAHVGLAKALRAVRWRKALAAVAMPCCNYYKALSLPDATPIFEQEDPGVVSPHRLLRIWRWTADDAELPAAVPRPQVSEASLS
mmetsp:Transcript_23041/g.64835  ORF Transcript_23041/g.64835 Transcript_23041/m.64835 type:complete len:370 (-) Transcript_23041:55-1164(-)